MEGMEGNGTEGMAWRGWKGATGPRPAVLSGRSEGPPRPVPPGSSGRGARTGPRPPRCHCGQHGRGHTELGVCSLRSDSGTGRSLHGRPIPAVPRAGLVERAPHGRAAIRPALRSFQYKPLDFSVNSPPPTQRVPTAHGQGSIRPRLRSFKPKAFGFSPNPPPQTEGLSCWFCCCDNSCQQHLFCSITPLFSLVNGTSSELQVKPVFSPQALTKNYRVTRETTAGNFFRM